MAVDGTTTPRPVPSPALAASLTTRPRPGAPADAKRSRDGAPAGLRRGAAVGRYTVAEPIGAGGMGVVYRARDPELDRDVAIKLLRPDRSWVDTVQRTGDLLREGRAAAQLAHPNVVRIFDVGTVGRELFIAMEYLEGQTLRTWLEAEPRSRAAVVDAFADAGRGLAAAHRAGLVHGDFKPRNVMVTEDGRVVVLDFGLGHWEERTVPEPRADEERAVSGTPPFMAPELFDGRPPTPASDQFAFCVALYQALVGAHPFGPGSTPQLHGDPAVPPPRARVPGRMWNALSQGLSRDLASRFTTMDELLDRIAPPARRSRLALGLTAGAALGALVVAVSATERPGCERGAERMAEAWAEPRQTLDGMRDGPTYERLRDRLDDYAEAWAAQWDEACQAHHIDGTLSADLFDRRVGCLQRTRAELVALVEQLKRDGTSLSEAAEAGSRLTPLATCEDVQALAAGSGRPTDPATREAIAILQEDIAREHTRGQFATEREDALSRLDEHLTQAAELGSEVTLARGHLARGAALTRAGREREGVAAYRLAIHHAEAAGDDPLAADVAASLVHTSGVLDDPEQASLWADYARAKLARADLEESALALSLMASEGVALRRAGETAAAIDVLEKALEIHDETGLASPEVVSDLHGALGIAYRADTKFEAARESTERALEARRGLYGDEHPLVGHSLYNLATIHMQMGDVETARSVLEQAQAIFDRDPRAVKASLKVVALLGPLLAEHQELEAAEKLLADAVARARPVYGNDAYDLNPLLINHARVLLLLQRPDQAVSAAREGLAIGQAVRGEDYPPLRTDFRILGEALLQAGRASEAVQPLTRAHALTPADHPSRQVLEEIIAEARRQASPTPPPSPAE